VRLGLRLQLFYLEQLLHWVDEQGTEHAPPFGLSIMLLVVSNTIAMGVRPSLLKSPTPGAALPEHARYGLGRR